MSTRIAAVPETFMFASRVDQAPIFVRKWLPPGGIRPRATVQITHGIAEHSGRYALADAHPGRAVMRNRSAPAGRYGVKKGTQP